MSLNVWRLLHVVGDIAWIMMFLVFVIPVSKTLQQIFGMSEFFSLVLSVVIVRLAIWLLEIVYEEPVLTVLKPKEVTDARNR